MGSSRSRAAAYCKPKSAPHPQPLSPEYRGEGSKTLRGWRDNNRIKNYFINKLLNRQIEVTRQIAPHTMNVVSGIAGGIGLHVNEFDQE